MLESHRLLETMVTRSWPVVRWIYQDVGAFNLEFFSLKMAATMSFWAGVSKIILGFNIFFPSDTGSSQLKPDFDSRKPRNR